MKRGDLAKSCAESIRNDVRTRPFGRWVKSGKLLDSIRADGTAVVVDGDRLQRDDTKRQFVRECVNDPTNDTGFEKVLDETITEGLSGE